MGTFTVFNGPQGASGVSTKDITGLINAYENMLTSLKEHTTDTVSNENDIHGIIAYLKSIASSNTSTSNKLLTENDVDTKLTKYVPITSVSDKASNTDLLLAKSDIISLVDEKLEDYVTNDKFEGFATTENVDKQLEDYVKEEVTSSKATSDNPLITLTEVIEQITKQLTDEKGVNVTKLIVDTITATKQYIVQLQIGNLIDFKKWYKTNALFYAGTGIVTSTGTNGIYIIGELLTDITNTNDTNVKSGKAYLKYIDKNNFDAIVDMTATKVDDGWKGSISAQVSKGKGTWNNLRFHLVYGTASDGDHVYLAMSADDLFTNVNKASFILYSSGVNFKAVTTNASQITHGLADSAAIDSNTTGATLVDTLGVTQLNSILLATDNLTTSDNTPLITVKDEKDSNDNDIKVVYIGGTGIDDIYYYQRPKLYDRENNTKSVFVTAQDISDGVQMPLGAITIWGQTKSVTYADTKTNVEVLTNIPDGYISIHDYVLNDDGVAKDNANTSGEITLSVADYPELAKVFNATGDVFTVPCRTFAIMKAKHIEPEELTVTEKTVTIEEQIEQLQAQLKDLTAKLASATNSTNAENDEGETSDSNTDVSDDE